MCIKAMPHFPFIYFTKFFLFAFIFKTAQALRCSPETVHSRRLLVELASSLDFVSLLSPPLLSFFFLFSYQLFLDLHRFLECFLRLFIFLVIVLAIWCCMLCFSVGVWISGCFTVLNLVIGCWFTLISWVFWFYVLGCSCVFTRYVHLYV